MKLGDVIQDSDNLYVVTELENDQVTRRELLRDYISKVVIVKVGNEYKQINEVLDEFCDEYLRKNNIINK